MMVVNSIQQSTTIKQYIDLKVANITVEQKIFLATNEVGTYCYHNTPN